MRIANSSPLIPALVLLFFPLALPGQSRYRPATLLLQNMETREVMISYPDIKKSPPFIKVRMPGRRRKTDIYLPGDIEEFKVGDIIFFSRNVSIDKTPYNIEDFNSEEGRKIVHERVFLQLLVRGSASLMLHVDESGREHFYIETGTSGIVELEQIAEIKETGYQEEGLPGKKIVIQPEYRAQLGQFLADCYQLSNIIAMISYDRRELTDLFNSYNGFTGDGSQYVSEIEKVKLITGVTAGANLTMIDFEGSVSKDIAIAKFTRDISPSFGASANLVFPGRYRSLSIYNEISFSSYSGSANYTDYTNELDYLKVDAQISYSYIKLSNSFRYTFPGNKARPFLHAGISNSVKLSLVNEMTTEHHFYTTIYTYEGEALEEVRVIEQEIFLGAGYILGKFYLEFRAGAGNGISGVNMLKSWSRTAGFSAGFSF